MIEKLSRRRFLALSSTAAAVPLAGCIPTMKVGSPYASAIPAMPPAPGPEGVLVNDLHSQLNPTRVARIVKPASVAELTAEIARAKSERRSVSIAGGRHAMGGQQFGDASVLVDTRSLSRVLNFDRENGVVTVEGGIQWPELIKFLNEVQTEWGIFQKQTGADRLSLAGALAWPESKADHQPGPCIRSRRCNR
jgi:hypothetical protein